MRYISILVFLLIGIFSNAQYEMGDACKDMSRIMEMEQHAAKEAIRPPMMIARGVRLPIMDTETPSIVKIPPPTIPPRAMAMSSGKPRSLFLSRCCSKSLSSLFNDIRKSKLLPRHSSF